MPFREFRDQVRAALVEAAGKLQHPNVEFSLEEPPRTDLGDLSSNISFQLAKNLGKNVKEVARHVSENIDIEHSDLVEAVSPHESGYVNFTVKYPELAYRTVSRASRDQRYGFVDVGKEEKVMVEHTSVNPNKALHVGHLRNIVLGDSVARILKFTNHKVTVLNYIDDLGVQVAELLLGFKLLGFPEEPPLNVKYDHYCGDSIYVKANEMIENDPNLAPELKRILKEMEDSESETALLASKVTQRILREQLKTCWRLGVRYDCLSFESSILALHLWEEVFEELKQRQIARKAVEGKLNGCWVAEVEGDEKVLVRSDGTTTYIAKDLANASWKMGIIPDRFRYKSFTVQPDDTSLWATTNEKTTNPGLSFGGSERSITVIDIRQSRLQKIASGILQDLAGKDVADRYQYLGYEVVALSRNTASELGLSAGEAPFLHMSGRKGTYVNADDVLDALHRRAYQETKKRNPDVDEKWLSSVSEKIAVAAIRYELVKQDLEKMSIFDLAEALRLEGDTGPYILYAKARASRIIERSGENPEATREGSAMLTHMSEKKLVKSISKFDLIVEEAARTLAPKILARYAWSLSVEFNDFYEQCPVLQEADSSLRSARLALVAAFGNTVTQTLNLLGIESPTRI